MADTNTAVVYGHDLVDHLFPLHRPQTPVVEETMDIVRASFIDLAHELADLLPDGLDQTLAIRQLHQAMMYAIGCLANNQMG